jgi:hypothetical protein
MRQLLLSGGGGGFFAKRVATFLDLRSLGHACQVCKAWKRACYSPSLVEDCIARGGISDSQRSLIWLTMLEMRGEDGRGSGVLSVLAPACTSSAQTEGQDFLRDSLARRLTDKALNDETATLSVSRISLSRSQSVPLSSSVVSTPEERMSWGRRMWFGLPSASALSPHSSPCSGKVTPPPGVVGRRVSLDDGSFWDNNGVARTPGLFDALLVSAEAMDSHDLGGVKGPKRSSLNDIEKDVDRTANYKDVDSLRGVLRCLSIFMPSSVGYVQGMNFLCRFVLECIGKDSHIQNVKEEAFWLMAGLMSKFGLLGLYAPGMPLLRLRLYQLDKLIMWNMPLLFQHLHDCEVVSDLYATSWFITLLADGSLLGNVGTPLACPASKWSAQLRGLIPTNFPFFQDSLMELWDHLFLRVNSSADEQWSVIYRVVLELLRRAESLLLDINVSAGTCSLSLARGGEKREDDVSGVRISRVGSHCIPFTSLQQLAELVQGLGRIPRQMVGAGGVRELMSSAKEHFEHSMEMPEQLQMLKSQYEAMRSTANSEY